MKNLTVPDVVRRFRTQWKAKEGCTVSAEEIAGFLEHPESSVLQAMVQQTRPIAFQGREQAAAFVAAALPLVPKMGELGYPHHGSPRSVLLGMLARIRAMQGDLEEADKIAGEIAILELRAFYLMEAYAASRPLPAVLRRWPIYFYTRTEIRIEPFPATQTGELTVSSVRCGMTGALRLPWRNAGSNRSTSTGACLRTSGIER